MIISARRIELTKRFPLTISRGTITGSTSVIVTVTHDDVTGMGEMSPSDVTGDTAELCEESVASIASELIDVSPLARHTVYRILEHQQAKSATRCAVDLALHDWMGKRIGLPLLEAWGLNRSDIPATSVTIGINPPDVVEDRTIEILQRTGAKVLKVKLGSPQGRDHDREIILAAQRGAKSLGLSLEWRVDANAGWTIGESIEMSHWLAERGVTYIEQPLAVADDAALGELSKRSALPIYADESVQSSADVARLAGSVAGVNLKLMKAGGIEEGLRIIHTAKALGLNVMIGCMGETQLAIAAGVHLSALADEVDLDSFLNLIDDPFTGLEMVDGSVLPSHLPGLGIQLKESTELP